MSRSTRFSTFAIVAIASGLAIAQERLVTRVRAWRAQHELQILRALFDLVAISAPQLPQQ